MYIFMRVYFIPVFIQIPFAKAFWPINTKTVIIFSGGRGTMSQMKALFL